MSRITSCFDKLKAQQKKALVTYIINGDPGPDVTVPVMHGLVAAGVDIIELGIPFSDPMADGPVIQLGHERALAKGASLRTALTAVKTFREQNQTTPVVLMGYENPIERMGYEVFTETAADAGVDGMIIVDLPPEEAVELNRQLKSRNMENIFLLAPSTSEQRAKKIMALASGFLYYVSLKGVTGAGNLDVDAVNEKLTQFRQLTDLPLCVGFGIKDGATAKAVTAHADGAVVGSLLVNKMGELASQSDAEIVAALTQLITPIRQALDSL